MEELRTLKSKKGLIFSVMLSLLMAISAFCVYLMPTTNTAQTAIAETGDTVTSETTDISEITDRWEDVETEPLAITGSSFEIDSDTDLVNFAKNVNGGNKYSNYIVYLTKDIDLSGKIWTPIGISTSNYFNGIFDGRGYKITGLTINDSTNYTYQGLFGYVGTGATIRNLYLEGVNIQSDAQYIGGLAGGIARSSLTITTYKPSIYAQVINCGVSGYIKSQYPSTGYVGGLVGNVNYSDIFKSFSTVSIDATSSSTYVGGLVGNFANRVSYRGRPVVGGPITPIQNAYSSIKQCFYYSEVGLSGGSDSYRGFVGNATAGSTTYINDVYTSSPYLYGTTSVSNGRRVSDGSLWETDSNGIMHGVSMQILKGVGNIYVETTILKAEYNSSSNTVSEVATKKEPDIYIYNIITGESTGTTQYNAESNYNFPYLEIERNVASGAKDGTDVIATTGTSGLISFDKESSGTGGTASYSNNGSYYKSSAAYLSLSNINGDVLVQSSGPAYAFNLGKVSSYYQVTLHSRGVWQEVKLNFYEYANVGATKFISTNKFTTDVGLVESYAEFYDNLSFGSVFTTANLGESTTSSRTVWIPHNEPYTISFDSNIDGVNYVEMMTGWGSGTTTSNDGVTRITSAVDLKKIDNNSVVTLNVLPEVDTTYISGSKITKPRTESNAINYYFNNLQQVTLDLYDENDENSVLYQEISGTYPTLVNSSYSSASLNTANGTTLSINVMANSNLRTTGFSIGNIASGSGAVYQFSGSSVPFTTLSANGKYAPYWPEFCLDGFYLGSEKIIDNTQVGDSASFGENISPTLSCSSYTWNFAADNPQTLVAQWKPYQGKTELQFGLTKDNGDTSYYTPSLAYNNDLIQDNSTDFVTLKDYETDVVNATSGLTSSVLRLSNQSAVFKLTITQGYQLKTDGALTLDLTNGDDLIVDYLKGFNGTYAGSSGNLLIGNEIIIVWDQGTGVVTIEFDHLMGITGITFELEPRKLSISYGATSGSEDNSTNDLISVNSENLNKTTVKSIDYLYGDVIDFNNVVACAGYTFTGTVNIYLNGSLENSLFSVSRNGNQVTLSPSNWTFTVDRAPQIRIEFVVTRNSGTIEVKFTGLDQQYLTNSEYVKYSLTGTDTSSGANPLTTSVNTADNKTLTVQLIGVSSFVDISDVESELKGNQVDISGLPQGNVDSFTLNLQNFKMVQDGVVTITVTFKVAEATVDVIRRDTKNGATISEKPLAEDKVLTYGFAIDKDINVPTLNFIDGNNPENNFSVPVDYTSSSVSSIKVYRDNSEIGDITTNNNSMDSTITGFSDGANIQIVIEYEQLSSQVFLWRTRIPNGSTTISNTEKITSAESSEVAVGESIDLVDNSAPNGYTLKGWFYVGGDENRTDITGLNFTSLLPANIGSITLIAPNEQSSSQNEINIRNYMFFIAVYEANIYTLSFDTSDFTDDVQNQDYNVVLSNNNTLSIEYSTNVVEGTIPTASLKDNNMLRFTGWQNKDYGIYLEYDEGLGTFSITASWSGTPSGNTIVLEPVFEPKTVTLHYCDENGNTTGQTTTVVYGQTPTSTLNVPSAKQGYTFGGWMYDDEIIYPYNNGSWGTLQDWTAMVLDANLIPVWNAVTVEVTLHAGLGQFASGVSSFTANVRFGTNDYMPNGSLTNPIWSTTGATYEFAGYYRAILNGKDYYFYDAADLLDRNTVCDFTTNIIFYACYNLVSVDATLAVTGQNSASWVYDGQSYNLAVSLPSDLPLTMGSVTYSKDGQVITNTSLKDVAQSGVYTCTVSVTGGETTSGSIRVFTSGTVTATAQLEVNISPKTVTISQNGVHTNVIEKVFDNTVNAPSNIIFNGFISGDSVTGSLSYVDKNVGTDKEIKVTLSGSDSGNYVCEEVTGEITPYEIIFNVSGSKYRVGAEDEKISIESQNITLDSSSSRFLTQIGISPSISLQTSRNVAGIYTYGGGANAIEVVNFALNGTDVNQNNFTYTISGQYELVDAGAEDIVVQIRLHCDDTDDLDISTLGTITVNGTYNQISENGTQNVYIVDTRSHFQQNSTLSLVLNRNVNYWIDRVLVNSVETSVNINTTSNQDNISYTITDLASGTIIIDIYITTLSNITFNYNLNEGETLSGSLPQTTKFAYQKTISQSMSEYDAVLPSAEDINREGFVFTGWKLESNNQDITTSTVWSFRGDATLVAQYSISDIEVEFYADDILGEIVSNASTFEQTYDGASHILEYEITNQNDSAINYSYSWRRNSAQMSNTSNNLTVTNVQDSGTYTVTIRATSKQNSLIYTTLTLTLTVNIIPAELFRNGYIITKEYDGTTATPSISISINGQTVQVAGVYTAKNAGSGLDENLTRWTIDGVRADTSNLNYTLNFDDIDKEASVITQKQVTLNIGEQTKTYDGTVFTYDGSYTDQTPFDYHIETISSNVGTYNQDSENLTLSITGDVLANFDITISGSLIITEAQLDITWQGTSTVTFDAKYHSVYPDVPDYVIITGITYSIGSDVIYDYSSLEENLGAYNAGVYTVTFTYENSNNNVVINNGISTTLTINKRTIYVDFDGIFAEKVYDGTTDVITDNVPNIYNNSALTELLSNVITTESALPQLEFSYENQVAGQNKDINVALVDSTNYTISGSYDTLKGNISKRDAVVYVTAEKAYDATPNYIVNAQDVSAEGLVEGEVISGTITFIGVSNSGSYYNLKSIEKNIALYFGAYRYDTNYNVTFIDSTAEQQDDNYLIINKAQVVVSTDRNKQYEYTGEEVEITYSFTNSANASVVPSAENVLFAYTATNTDTVLDSDKAVQVGSYTFTMSLGGLDAQNFDISGDINNIAFTITPRKILIQFEENIEFEYQNSIVKYKKDDGQPLESNEQSGTDRAILASDYSLGTGDEFEWSFTTKSKDFGTYYINNSDSVVRELTVWKGEVDYTRNYDFSFYQYSAIIINQQTINFNDISLVETTSEYNGLVKEITVEFYDKYLNDNVTFAFGDTDVTFSNLTYVTASGSSIPIQDPDDIKYAGTYTFGLNFTNYTVTNPGTLTYTITQSRLDLNIGNVSKVYDGTIMFDNVSLYDAIPAGAEQGENRAPYGDDDISVIGTYAQKDVGQNIKLTFTLQSGNPLVLASYYINDQNYVGEITQKDITLALPDTYVTYYTGEEVEINIENFNYELVNNETLQGNIIVPVANVGSYNLHDYLANLTFDLTASTLEGSASPISNYNILDVTGTLAVYPAQVIVNISETSKIYNGNVQGITVEYSAKEGFGAIVDSELSSVISISYTNEGGERVSPVNAGTYNIIISVSENSNYRVINDAGDAVVSFTSGQILLINKRNVAVNVNYTHAYNGEVANYTIQSSDISDPTQNNTGGLVAGHALSGSLLTNNSAPNRYAINNMTSDQLDTSSAVYPQNVHIVIVSSSSDVTANYNIIYTATILIVADVQNIDSGNIDTIEYCAEDVTKLDTFTVKFTFGGAEYELEYNGSIQFGNGYTATLTGLARYTGDGSTVDTTGAKDVGQYRILLRITNADEELSVSDKTIDFTIVQRAITEINGDFDKYYDGTSEVINDLSSPNIYESDVSGVEIRGYYTQNSSYVFGVGTYAITFVLDGDRSHNYRIALSDTIMGTISRQPIILSLTDSVTVYYTGEEVTLQITQFEALKQDDQDASISSIISSLTGTTIVVTEVNAGVYNLSTLFTQNSIRTNLSGSIDILDNYEIVGYSGELTIKPCEIELSIDNTTTTYNAQGQSVTYTIEAQNGKIVEADRDSIITILYNGESELPVNAGQYQITAKVSDDFTNNYVISNGGQQGTQFDYGTFTIEKREIAIDIGTKTLPYTSAPVICNITVDDIISTSTNPSGLISSHTVSGYYITSGSAIIDSEGVEIIYTIGGETYYLTKVDFDILQDGVSVLSNYDLKSQQGSVQIIEAVAGTIDTSHLDNLIYSATDFVESGDIRISAEVSGMLVTIVYGQTHPNGILTGLRDENRNPVSEARNAGTYYVYLTLNGTDTQNQEIEFTIAPRQITNITYTRDKNYDRTSTIIGNISSTQIYEEDRNNVVLRGDYVDQTGTPISTKGEHYVLFSFSGSGSMESNYTLPDFTQNTGNILARDIYLEISGVDNQYYTYYTNQSVRIDIGNFSAHLDDTDAIISDFSNVSGEVVINLLDSGSYDLSQNFGSISFDALTATDDYLENYNIVAVNGTLVIQKAEVVVTISDYEKVYNGEVQTPTFTPSINNGHGALAHENILSAQYKLQNSDSYINMPINAGEYEILLSIQSAFSANYTLYFNDEVVSSYTANEHLVISPKGVTITVRPEAYTYSGSNIVYTIQTADVNGLVSGHTPMGTLTTNGHRGGVYVFKGVYTIGGDYTSEQITPSIVITSSTNAVTSNYSIQIDAEITIISSLTNLDTSALDGLVYDKTDKVENGEIVLSLLVDDEVKQFVYGKQYDGEVTFGALSYTGESVEANDSTVIYAGEYTFTVTFNINGATLEQSVTFTVAQKTISQTTFEANKVYDATNVVLGNIISTDIINSDDVTISGTYASVNAGTHDITLSLSGEDEFNYILNSNLGLSGEITRRNITLSVTNAIDYIGANPQIAPDNLTVGGLGLVAGQNMSGYIVLLRTNAGTYGFTIANVDLSNFTIVSDTSLDVTSNYSITLEGQVQIKALSLTLSVGDIDLTYDAQIKDIRPFLSFEESLSDNVLAEALGAITISYNQTPLNAGTYEATVTSSSSNFVITYGENNIVEFEVKKRDLQINIGEIEYAFNPTSTHETQFGADYLIGLVEGQVVDGSFALSEAGLGVGEYTFNANPGIIIVSLAIFVNGEDILSLNYNLSEEMLGSITITPFDLTSSQVWLTENQFTYRGADISTLITVNFRDANGINRQITSQNTTYGSFTITGELNEQGLPVNVGDYVVNVIINNYNLENSELSLEITPKTITNITFESEREYNGTSYIYNSNNSTSLFSPNILSADRSQLTLNGHFVDEEGNYTSLVGEHSIVFEFTEPDTYPALNYIINVDAVGEILAREATVTITHQFAYSASGNYLLTLENNSGDFATTGLLPTDTLSGQIALNGLARVIGSITENQIDISGLKILDDESNDVTSNYNLAIVSNIEIVKAQIQISFDDLDTTYEYNNAQVVITPTFSFANSSDEVLLDYLNVLYTGTRYSSADAPRNVGSYTLTYSVVPDLEEFYEIISEASFDFAITAYEIVLEVGDIPSDIFYKQYGSNDPELRYTITSDFDEEITITFSRESGESIGTYDLYINEWDNTNYTVTFAEGAGADLFRITKAGTLNIVILDTPENREILQKTYDNQNIAPVDISTLNYEADGEQLSGTISFQTGVNVGNYGLANSHNLVNGNYETFAVTSLVDFVINQKSISLEVTGGDKEYDASNAFFGTINILDSEGEILDSQVYPLVANATFTSVNVSNDVALDISFSGDNITNYDVTNSVSANITKRNVTITPDSNQTIVYGTLDYVITYQIIDNGTSVFTGNLASEISGELYVESYDAGSQPILSNLTSNNLNITFTPDVVLEIEKKELTITSSDNFQKVYDTTNDVTGELTIQGLIEGDIVEVTAYYDSPDAGDNKTVTFVLSGDDANNYYAEDVHGVILERGVTLNYVYVTDSFSMINEDLLQNTSRQNDSLIYGSAIKTSIGTLPVPSHEGYTFDGWYLDEDFTILITDETVIDENIWPIDTEMMTAYAKWTIKQFNLTVQIATRVDGTYVTDAQNPGGTHDNINGLYNYGEVVSLTDRATENNGYTFVGYSLELLLDVDSNILTNGITIGANDIVVYAKFAPLSVTITLNSNGGVFDTNIEGWTFNNTNTIATRDVEFNSEIGVSLPTASRIGYTQDVTLWEDVDGTTYPIDANTIMGEDYYPECTFFVHYNADDFDLVLNANGGYFEDVDTSVWTISSTDSQGRATIITKTVIYDSPVGTILIPKRDGYEFGSWSIDNFDENYIWQSINQGEITANWTEMEFDIEITAEHGIVEYRVVNSSLLEVETGRVDNTTEVITVKTTDRLILTATNDAGYSFASWNSDKQDIDGLITSQVSTRTEFIMDYFVEAVFEPNDNTITIVVNNPNRGSASAGENSTSPEDDSFEIVVKTGQTLDILATTNEGYTIADWQVSGAGDVVYSLSGTSTDSERTLSDFVSDLTVTVYFAPSGNDLTIQADATKGTIHYNNNGQEIVTSGSYTARNVLTESTFEFDINALHGYKIDLDLSNWLFDTTSLNKGLIQVESDDGGYTAHITFTGFTSSGTIIVPFVNDEFEVNIDVVLKDDSTFTQYDVEDILSVQNGDNLTLLSSGQSFAGEYLSQVILGAEDVIEGYNFLTYSISSTRIESISSNTGFVGYTEDGDVIYSIVDDLTLYLVYEIEKFDVTFVVNDQTMGSLSYGVDGNIAYIRTTSVKYGYDSSAVTAVAGEYFEFEKWVRVEYVDGEYVPYLVNGQPVEYTDATLVVQNVTENCAYMAMFTGIPVSFSVSLVLPEEDVFTDEQIDFAGLSILGENTNTSITSTQRDGNTITYIISTITGEDIDLSIACAEGYEYEGILTMDPRILFSIIKSDSDITFSLENLYLSTIIELSIRAKVYEIAFNLVGSADGAEIYPLSNIEGIVGYEYSFDRNSLIFRAKTGCDVQSLLYVLNGYKLVDNSYFETFGEVEYSESSFSASYLGTLSDVSGDIEIDVEIEPNVYSVTFDLAYDVEGNRTLTSVVSHGQTIFVPELSADFISPTRYAYRFIGYTTIDLTSPDAVAGTYYYFDEGGIYSYVLQNNTLTKVYGFRGAENATPSITSGIDYDVTLYASWEEIAYEVELVFVPGFALDQTSLNYNEIFPNSAGRGEISEDGTTVGIEYTPGSDVIVYAPSGFDGYSYYGWSYTEGITSKTDTNLSTGVCEFNMGEEKVVIYLYYGMDVTTSASAGGSAEASSDIALYGETITISATSEYGYYFDHWLENSSEIQNSQATMNVEIIAPTNFVAMFVGERIEVNLNQVDNATLSITGTTGTANEYRIGDTITLTISDITYGYEHRGWVSGGYSGKISTVDSNNFTYTIVPEDLTRGFVTFELSMGARTVNVRFSVVGEGDCGDILINNISVAQQTLSYVYDTLLNITVNTSDRYELVSFTLNGETITLDSQASIEMLINQSLGFTCDGTNEFVATFRKMLWTDVWQPFNGLGTEDSPYLIETREQLAAIAYLINNNIAVEVGATPYADAYYLITTNLPLTEKFWVPIGTMENPFNGTFNLNGYDITDLEPYDWAYVNAHPDGMPDGLFGYIGENARFITGDWHYTTTLIIIFSVIGGILLIILMIILILVLRRKRMRKLSAASSSIDLMSQDELLKAQKLKSRKSNDKQSKK